MRGKGARQKDLVRLVLSRADEDLGQIALEFERRFNEPLEIAVKENCQEREVREVLVELVRRAKKEME